jgi:8-oxo-dGTP pyrophosphatase MutT (NUDIX family)
MQATEPLFSAPLSSAPLSTALDAAERERLRVRWGSFPVEQAALAVASPFLTGKNQLLTSRGRRAEICYVLHEGKPAEALLLHIKRFYPAEAFRLPTGGIQVGEGVEATLAREIEEETGLQVGSAGRLGVTVERFLGVVAYDMVHATLGAQPFATYHFLVRKQTGVSLTPQDASEEIAGWRWAAADQLQQVADVLEAVGTRPHPVGATWGDWGRFRAISHRFVARALA